MVKYHSWLSNFGIEDDKLLLHGLLHIKIIRCIDLPNTDGMRGFSKLASKIPGVSKDLTDAFVTVSTDDQRLAKTRVIMDDLNPVFNESFYVSVAHYAKGLSIKVLDLDPMGLHEKVGSTFLPSADLIQFCEESGKGLRVGVHKVATLYKGKVIKRGQIEYFIQLIPKESSLCSSPNVPGVYFKPRDGNIVKLYVNADDGDDMAPTVTYGGENNDEKVWSPPRLWRDIYDALCAAKSFIYITGWAVDTSQSLLRGEERFKALNGAYSPLIGELLKQKAEEGVCVNMLVWDDATSNPTALRPVGMMGTHDEESRMFFKGSKVNFVLAPMKGGDENLIQEKIAKLVMFTHHQKIVLVDSPVDEGNPDVREPLAFVGGIDLTDGRWDNRKHPLFRTLASDHNEDWYNGCFNVNVREVGPRQPWHDIHCSLRGPGTMDVIANFRERWYKQASNLAGGLIDLHSAGIEPHVHETKEEWCSQVLRSIDARTCVFDKARLSHYDDVDLDHMEGITYEGDDIHVKEDTRGKFIAGAEQTRSFRTASTEKFIFENDLELKKGRYVDKSMHKGWVHHIRRAKHTIYIESQYFLGSSHLWDNVTTAKCGNLIPAEVTLKICDKIAQGERFTAYILVPLWPEGIPASSSVQDILLWQHYTMEAMYHRIATALKKAERHNETPEDYLNFYALATRETVAGSQATGTPTTKDEKQLHETRRHQIYVHSKMLIVDDAVTIIGSANINQRSMDGCRDSEIAVASFQPAYVATDSDVPHGDVHAFRLHCWATAMNKMEDVFKDPTSVACVRRVNEIAEENWKKFTAEETTDMDSHLIPYPITLDSDGDICSREGFFPDTKANITGSKTKSVLPEILTT